ncbi:MAG: hypothetical protein A2X99_06070 [Deltaproteobacteria bacterium GWB2_55_19]|nr:MAG: hypothetical protein A2X99_06070 [Deltaproteobacteria bacterium GWB2_55_19]
MKLDCIGSKNTLWALAFIFLYLMGMVFSYTPYGTGDKTEYIMSTESLLYDGDLVYRPHVDLKRHLERKPETIDYDPAGIYLMKNTRSGKVRLGAHSFYYPLASAPFYLFFSSFGKSFSHYGFYVLNAILFFLSVLMGYLYLREKNAEGLSLAASAVFFFFSAAASYVLWIHSEVFMLFLTTAFIFLWQRKWYYSASAIMGVAAGVKTPMLALLLPFWFDLASKREYRRAALGLVVTAVFASPQLLYNFYHFKSFSPIVKEGFASMQFITPSTVIGSFIDPFYGLIWFYPLVVLCLVNMERSIKNYLLMFSSVLIVTGMNGTAHIYSHQVGLRYLMLVYPVFLFMVGEIRLTRVNKALLAISVFVIAGVVMNPVHNSQAPQVSKREHFTYLPYKAARFVFGLEDNPEVAFHFSRKVGRSAALLDDDRHFKGDAWTLGGEPLKLLLNDVSSGEVSFRLLGWGKKEPQKLRVTLNGRKEFTYLLQPGIVNNIIVPVTENDIRKYSRRWVRNLVYLDLLAEPWVPVEATNGANPDPRTLGVKLVGLFNNGSYIYPGPDTDIYTRLEAAGVTVSPGVLTPDRWTVGGEEARFDISGLQKGRLVVRLRAWDKDSPQKITLGFNGKRHTKAVSPGVVAVFDIEVPASAVSGGGPVSFRVLADGWAPSHIVKGSMDGRSLGAWLDGIENNGRALLN